MKVAGKHYRTIYPVEDGQVVEGIPTAYALHDLSGKLGVDMPVTENVYEVLANGRSPAESVRALMGREPTQEHGAK